MYEYKVREVIKVVDGDTIDCVIDLGFGMRGTFRFRLLGIDTPESYGQHAEPTGTTAKQFTEQWINARLAGLTVRTFKASNMTVGIGDGAFGRWLGEFITPGGENLTHALHAAGHVKIT